MNHFIALVIGAVSVAALLAVGGLVVARRVLPQPVLERHNDVLGHVYPVLAVLNTVVLAFTAIAVWGRYSEARQIAEREANALVDLFRHAVALTDQVELQERILRYADLVETDEWAAMAHGEASPEAAQAYAAIWRAYLALAPTTDREKLWLEQSIERLNDLDNSRNLRLVRSRLRTPGAMWITLCTLSAVTVVFSYFFGFRNFRLHMLMTGATAAALALLLSLIWALQAPFGHIAPVAPDALREAVDVFEKWK